MLTILDFRQNSYYCMQFRKKKKLTIAFCTKLKHFICILFLVEFIHFMMNQSFLLRFKFVDGI